MKTTYSNVTNILQFLFLTLFLLSVIVLHAATYTVTNTNDSGVGSLRQAIIDAKGTATADNINFNIPGIAPHTINLLSPLPQINGINGDGTIIDGTTQPTNGYTGTSPKIIIIGAGAGNGLNIVSDNCEVYGLLINNFNNGIRVTGDNVIIGILNKGNVINGCTSNGISCSNSTILNISIAANYIGTDYLGTTAIPNGGSGINISGTTVSVQNIGGSTLGEGNVISANANHGITISASTLFPGTNIQGNYIGVNANGSACLGNGGDGITISGTNTNGNNIGGNTLASMNIISCNTGVGIDITGTNSSGNVIQGNHIGVDITGNLDFGNGSHGITNNGTTVGMTIGGNGVGEGNVISGNGGHGITSGSATTPTITIKGNIIGLNKSGIAAIPNDMSGIRGNGGTTATITIGGNSTSDRNIISSNGAHGIDLQFATNTSYSINNNYIGTDISGTLNFGNIQNGIYTNAAGVQIGSTTAGRSNIIAYNGLEGIRIHSRNQNDIHLNSIFCNNQLGGSGKGIILTGGANNNILAPIINTATVSSSFVEGTAPIGSRIEIFTNDLCCEGKNHITFVTADGAGNWSYSGALSGNSVSATAHLASDGTSELSNCVLTCILTTANTGPDDTICSGDTYFIPSASTNNADSLRWSTLGDGIFDDPTLINPTYTPGNTDTLSGNVVLILRAYGVNLSCGDAYDTLNLTIFPFPTGTTGPNDTVCEADGLVNLTSYETGTTGGIWSGSGVTGSNFDPSGLSGNITLKYIVGIISCQDSSILTITVQPDVDPSLTAATDTLCLAGGTTIDLTTLEAGTTGGSWSGTGVSGTTFTSPGVGDYVLTYTVGNAPCQETANTTISVIANPNPTLTLANDTLCLGSGTTIDLTTYEAATTGGIWSGTGVTGTTFTSPGVGDYTLTYTVGIAPCQETATIDIHVQPDVDPTLTMTNDSVCDTYGLVDLTTYEAGTTGGAWSGNGVTGTDFDPAGLSGNYTLTYTVGVAPCEESATLTMKVNLLPTVAPINPSECENIPGTKQALNIDVTGLETTLNPTGTFVWYTDNTYGVPFTPTSETVDSGEVFYFEVIINGCTLQDSVTYSVGDNILLTDPQPEFCEDIVGSGSVTGIDLTSFNNGVFVGATSYTWATGPTGVTINNGDSIRVDVQQGTCPIVSIFVHFTVNPDVDPSLTGATDTLCLDAATTIDLTTLEAGTTGGTWSGTGVTGTTFTSPGPGDYVLTYTVGLSICQESENITITVNSDVDPTLTLTTDTFCLNAITTLDLTTYEGGTTGGNWSGTGVSGTTFTSPGVGDYVLTYTVGTSPCQETMDLTISIHPLPAVFSTSMSLCDDGTGQGTFDLTTLNNTVNGGTSNTVTWYTDNTLLTLVVSENAFLTGPTRVYAEVMNPTTGCTDTTSIQLILDPLSTIIADTSAPICLGNPLSLTATGSGNGTITWYSDPAGTILIGTGSPFSPNVTSTGTFTYYVRETSTCSSAIDSVSVIIGGVTAAINANPITGPIPLDVLFGNGSTPNVTYFWDFGDGNNSSLFSPNHVYPKIGEYLVVLTVSDSAGCTAIDTVTIITFGESEILIPNVFTPNGDGTNDVFTVKSVNMESVEGVIYNRWGQLMYSWNHIKGYWDGTTLAGSEVPDGTYFYIISAKGLDGQEYFKKGTLSLIR
ncbi:MAG: gliding motility-associated C-terminal domain-containing protein [Vicingus serpentipes]|nr:gliding motility-associated C-terminal domain-containing protein [Vicingus serpentipes]